MSKLLAAYVHVTEEAARKGQDFDAARTTGLISVRDLVLDSFEQLAQHVESEGNPEAAFLIRRRIETAQRILK